jgi:hypothetical protein
MLFMIWPGASRGINRARLATSSRRTGLGGDRSPPAICTADLSARSRRPMRRGAIQTRSRNAASLNHGKGCDSWHIRFCKTDLTPLTRLGAVSTSFAANPRKSLGTIEPRKHLRLSALRSPRSPGNKEEGERKDRAYGEAGAAKQTAGGAMCVGRIRRADRFLTRSLARRGAP